MEGERADGEDDYEPGSFGDLDSGGRVGERYRSESFGKKDLLIGLVCLFLGPQGWIGGIIWQWRGTERRR